MGGAHWGLKADSELEFTEHCVYEYRWTVTRGKEGQEQEWAERGGDESLQHHKEHRCRKDPSVLSSGPRWPGLYTSATCPRTHARPLKGALGSPHNVHLNFSCIGLHQESAFLLRAPSVHLEDKARRLWSDLTPFSASLTPFFPALTLALLPAQVSSILPSPSQPQLPLKNRNLPDTLRLSPSLAPVSWRPSPDFSTWLLRPGVACPGPRPRTQYFPFTVLSDP